MSVRLTEYHDYLEKLASRLSHELRTPVAMVRSSIDNIALSHQEELSQPINNALSGIQRMSGIINRMKEAARVEQSIFASQRAEIDLKEFCHQYVDAYGQMNPDWSFEVILTGELNAIESSPELMAQLLDKLFSNAMDFAESSSVIRLYVEHNNDHIEVAVENRGPALPDVDTKELFASMVTLRDPKYRQPEQVNMGLGLYIVRLIAEYHGGDYFAYNTEDATGVRVGIRFSR
nr:ATP-binding protein [Pleionea sp. CnH1-48]